MTAHLHGDVVLEIGFVGDMTLRNIDLDCGDADCPGEHFAYEVLMKCEDGTLTVLVNREDAIRMASLIMRAATDKDPVLLASVLDRVQIGREKHEH